MNHKTQSYDQQVQVQVLVYFASKQWAISRLGVEQVKLGWVGGSLPYIPDEHASLKMTAITMLLILLPAQRAIGS